MVDMVVSNLEEMIFPDTEVKRATISNLKSLGFLVVDSYMVKRKKNGTLEDVYKILGIDCFRISDMEYWQSFRDRGYGVSYR